MNQEKLQNYEKSVLREYAIIQKRNHKPNQQSELIVAKSGAC